MTNQQLTDALSGSGEIRTHGTLSRTHTFQTRAGNHAGVRARAETPSNVDADSLGAQKDGAKDGFGVPVAYQSRDVSRGTSRPSLTAAELIAACRVPLSVPPGEAGLWTRRRIVAAHLGHPAAEAYVRHQIGGYGHYTILERATAATMHRDHGECVMEDSARELRRHLPILLAARGEVLITGLGLGCVLRGLLAKPEVRLVDVIEIDPAIVELTWPEFAGNPRVALHIGDAEALVWAPGTRWDFAWHDVWSETESLDLVHARLLAKYEPMVGAQGAWQMDRAVKRRWPLRPLLNARRRSRA